jgi:hypothetical protein
MRVTRQQLWTYLSNREDTYEQFLDCCDDGQTNGVTEEVFHDLKSLLDDEGRKPILPIIADFCMSEHGLGGDDLVSLADDVLSAIKDGYQVATWYGDKAEALVVGYKPDYLTVED